MLKTTINNLSTLDLLVDRGGLEIDDKDFVESRQEDVRKFYVIRMHNVLRNSLLAIECRLKHVCESLVQILYAHIFSPEIKFFFIFERRVTDFH